MISKRILAILIIIVITGSAYFGFSYLTSQGYVSELKIDSASTKPLSNAYGYTLYINLTIKFKGIMTITGFAQLSVCSFYLFLNSSYLQSQPRVCSMPPCCTTYYFSGTHHFSLYFYLAPLIVLPKSFNISFSVYSYLFNTISQTYVLLINNTFP